MNEQTTTTGPEDRPPVGNLTDFVKGCDENNPLQVEVAINTDGRVILFYDKELKTNISWFEYDLNTNRLDFVMDDGEVRNIGMALNPAIAKNVQNSYQILTILMDDKSGEAKTGQYIPVIIHRS